MLQAVDAMLIYISVEIIISYSQHDYRKQLSIYISVEIIISYSQHDESKAYSRIYISVEIIISYSLYETIV